MFIVDLEHGATNAPKQTQISLTQFIFSKLWERKFLNKYAKILTTGRDFEYEYWYRGSRYVK